MARSLLAALILISLGPSIWAGCNAPVVAADSADNYGGTLVIASASCGSSPRRIACRGQ